MTRAPKPTRPDIGSASSAAEAGGAEIVQVKVWVLGISPMVWRRVLVPSTCTLRELHGVIQVAMVPAKLAGTAVILRSEGEGTGKGILARALRQMLGQHGAAITGGRQLTGNFNAHLRDCVFLFADEIFCSGDKATAAVLNRLITEDTLFVEGKYANGIETANLLHIMAASNEEPAYALSSALFGEMSFALIKQRHRPA